jgi:hypothetical protein
VVWLTINQEMGPVSLSARPALSVCPSCCTGAETECYSILTQFFTDATCVDGCCTTEGLLPHGNSTFCGFNDDINSVIVSSGEGGLAGGLVLSVVVVVNVFWGGGVYELHH